MAKNIIEVVAVGKDLVSPEFEKMAKNSSKSMKKMAKKMSDLGKTMALRLTAPIVAFGVAATKQAVSFQAAMNFVGAVTKATEKEMLLLRDTAKDLGRTTQFSASQAAEAMKFLGLAGLKTNEIVGVMPKTLELAASAQLDLGSAANIVTGIIKGFSFEFSELARVNDVLVNAFTNTKTDLASLGQGLSKVGSTAKQLGFNFEEVTASLGLLAEKEFGGALGGTALRRILASLITLTPKASKAFNKYGIEVKKADGSLISIVKIVKEFEGAMKRGASQTEITQIAFEAFGQRGGPAFLALISQGSNKLETLTEKLKETGTAADIAAAQMKGLPGVFKRLVSVFESLNLAIIESGLDAFLIKIISLFSDLLAAMAKTNPTILAFTTIILGIVAVIPLLLIGLAAVKTALITLGLIGGGPVAATLIALIAGISLFGSSTAEASDLIDKSSIKIIKNLSDMGDELQETAQAADFGFKSMLDFSGAVKKLGIDSIESFTRAVENNLLVFDKALGVWKRTASFIGTEMTPIMREIVSIFGRPAQEFLKLGENQMLNIVKATDSFQMSLRTANISLDDFNKTSKDMQISFLRSIGLFPKMKEGLDDVSNASESLRKEIASLEKKANDAGKGQIEILQQQRDAFIERAKAQGSSVNEMIRIEEAFGSLILRIIRDGGKAGKIADEERVSSFQKAAESILNIGERLAENISSAFSTLLFDFFDDKIQDLTETWEKFGENLRDIFFKTIADISAELLKSGIVSFAKETFQAGISEKTTEEPDIAKGAAAAASTAVAAVGPDKIAAAAVALPGPAIAALVGVAVIAAVNSGVLKKIFNGIASFVKKIPQIFRDFAKEIPKLLLSLIDSILVIVETIPEIIFSLLIAIPDIVIGILEKIPRIVQRILEAIPTIVFNLLSNFGDIIVRVITALPDIITNLLKAIPDILINLFRDLPVQIANAIEDGVSDIGSNVGDVFTGGGGRNVFEKAGDFFSDLFHKGGIVRAHKGLNLAGDEVPIIAQTGEGVLSRRGMASLGGVNFDALNRGEGLGNNVIIQNVEMFPNVTEGDVLFNLPDTTLERWVRSRLFVTFDSLSRRGIVPEFAE